MAARYKDAADRKARKEASRIKRNATRREKRCPAFFHRGKFLDFTPRDLENPELRARLAALRNPKSTKEYVDAYNWLLNFKQGY